ncbi:MAG TPA: hypothetical protein VHJ39_05475 [Solirubrobacteraceae bacterium]|nr:hypothetical protein [Solirubrobacteraceae bacterium]
MCVEANAGSVWLCDNASGRCWISVPPRETVERLHPAADGEYREVALGGGRKHRQLVLVADAVDVGTELPVPSAARAAGG